MSEIILNENNFEEEVLNSDKPVLVDFWATWCGPCRMIAPLISQLAEKYDGKIKVCKADVDENAELASSYGVSSIPTLLIFKNGEIAAQRIGSASMPVLEAFIADNL
jgi:thioredoxin 1